MLREALDGSGVGIDHLRVVEGPSGTAVILVQPSGENSILIVGEAAAGAPSAALSTLGNRPRFMHS